MKCPYCNTEMEKGWIEQDLTHPLTWVSENKKENSFIPIHKTIKLTALLKGGTVLMYHCENCKKFIIDESDIER